MKIKLTEEQYKRVILKEESNTDSYPCMSVSVIGNAFSSMVCKKFPEKCKGKKDNKTDDTEEKSIINKEIEDLINGTKIDKSGMGLIFKPPSNYPKQHNIRRGWKVYSSKINKFFTYKSGYIDNNILSMRFMIPHGYGSLLKKVVENLSLPNYISVSFITDGSKDCYGWLDCDDVRVKIDFNKKGTCGKSDLANMIIDGKPINLGIDSKFLELKPF